MRICSWSVRSVLRSDTSGKVSQQRRCYANRDILSFRDREMWSDMFPREEANLFSKLVTGKAQTIYAGFDPTASSLHVGHMAVISSLIMCQRAGHKVIAVVGGATALVGDPSGRKTDRPQLKEDEVAYNSSRMESQLKGIFSNHEEFFWPDDWKKRFPLQPALVLNNLEWFRNLDLLSFLKQVGRKLRMNELLSRESVKSRLSPGESGMTLLEFAYQALQSYDWVHLYRKYGCRIQIGGHDQMGNLVTGRDLVSRTALPGIETDERIFALTVPLLTSETGDKYGKSAGNAVWLDPEMTSPYELYQFLYRTSDSDVPKLVKRLCPDPLKDLEQTVLADHAKDPGKLSAHKKLAETVTTLIHGKEGLASAKRTTEALFGSSPALLGHLSVQELTSALKGAAKVSLMLHPGTTVLELGLRAKCFAGEVDARRIIEGGGFYLNHRKVLFPDAVLIPGEHILPNGMTLARVGKRNHVLVQWLS